MLVLLGIYWMCNQLHLISLNYCVSILLMACF